MKFGKLKIKVPCDMKPGSHRKVEWICDCGKETITKIFLVTDGTTTSCGRCNEISAEEMTTRKFGELKMKYPKNIKPGSNEKVEWICDCGKEKFITLCDVISGHSISCGKCNMTFIDNKHKFGKLRIKESQLVLPKSHQKVEWICDCEKISLKSLYNVTSGHTKSCGRCKHSN